MGMSYGKLTWVGIVCMCTLLNISRAFSEEVPPKRGRYAAELFAFDEKAGAMMGKINAIPDTELKTYVLELYKEERERFVFAAEAEEKIAALDSKMGPAQKELHNFDNVFPHALQLVAAIKNSEEREGVLRALHRKKAAIEAKAAAEAVAQGSPDAEALTARATKSQTKVDLSAIQTKQDEILSRQNDMESTMRTNANYDAMQETIRQTHMQDMLDSKIYDLNKNR